MALLLNINTLEPDNTPGRAGMLTSSSVVAALPNTPAPAWGLRFADGLWSAPHAESGSSPSPDRVQRFRLRSRNQEHSDLALRRDVSIVLVEDNPADARLVRIALEEHGLEGEITIVTDGEMAIHYINSIDAQGLLCPDLVILDLNLPKTPGREVLECVRLSVVCHEAPVVILSSSDAAQDRADAARLGASRYIRKPSLLADFLHLGAMFTEELRELPN